MAKKYADGLPLARQEKIWAREGVELRRAIMANWVIQYTQGLLIAPVQTHEAGVSDTVRHSCR